MKEMISFLFLFDLFLSSKMSDEQSGLFTNDSTAENKRMRLSKEGKES